MSKTAKLHSSQALASGALSHSITIGTDTPGVHGAYKLTGVGLHAGSAISQTVTVTVIHAKGADYTQLLDTSTLSSATNYRFNPAYEIILQRGDKIVVGCTNSATPAITVYSTIELKRID